MKKHILLKMIAVLLLSLPIFVLSGCEEKTEPLGDRPALAVIVGAHSNSQKINADVIFDKIEAVYSAFGNSGIIVSDGRPTVEYDQNGTMLGFCKEDYIAASMGAKNRNEQYWQQHYLKPLLSVLRDDFDKLTPSDAEVDTLRALTEAKRVLDDLAKGCTKELLIYDTGLCTAGALSFLNEDLSKLLFSDAVDEAAIEALISELDSQNLIPDFSDVKVTWYGLGATAGEQAKLSKTHKANLQAIWGAILKKANALPCESKKAKDGYFVTMPAAAKALYDKAVTPVNPPATEITESTEPTETTEAAELLLPVHLPEDKVRFEDNTAILASEDEAISALEPYVELLNAHPEVSILLVGTTADPERNGGAIKLSEARAEKIKELLCALGLDENRIVETIGWGAKEPLYNEDEWQFNETTGKWEFINEIAKQNRSVWILPYDSAEAQEILSNLQNR